jgi:hypothetical protein
LKAQPKKHGLIWLSVGWNSAFSLRFSLGRNFTQPGAYSVVKDRRFDGIGHGPEQVGRRGHAVRRLLGLTFVCP